MRRTPYIQAKSNKWIAPVATLIDGLTELAKPARLVGIAHSMATAALQFCE
jgi:hypothetical protein